MVHRISQLLLPVRSYSSDQHLGPGVSLVCSGLRDRDGIQYGSSGRRWTGSPTIRQGGWAYHSIGKNGRVAPAPLPSNGQVTEVHQKQRWVERPLLLHGWRLNSSVFFPSPGNWFHLIWELLNHYRSIWHQPLKFYGP